MLQKHVLSYRDYRENIQQKALKNKQEKDAA